jgi:hypothetical protein
MCHNVLNNMFWCVATHGLSKKMMIQQLNNQVQICENNV